MSWDLDLVTLDGDAVASANYTHNTNRMIEAALVQIGHEAALQDTPQPWFASEALGQRAWWDLIHGKSGPEGAALLHAIAVELERDPARYDRMNPGNGWGSRENLARVLADLARSVPESTPTRWEACG